LPTSLSVGSLKLRVFHPSQESSLANSYTLCSFLKIALREQAAQVPGQVIWTRRYPLDEIEEWQVERAAGPAPANEAGRMNLAIRFSSNGSDGHRHCSSNSLPLRTYRHSPESRITPPMAAGITGYVWGLH
jgi:hypothetical protein